VVPPATTAAVIVPFSAMGCPAGQVCLPTLPMYSSTACMTAAARPVAEGMPCGQQECAPGLGCLVAEDRNELACLRLCPAGSHGVCHPDEHCAGTISAFSCVNFCVPLPPPCDVYAQDCPAADQECTRAINAETGAYYTGCRRAGASAEGESCGGGYSECQKGLVCAPVYAASGFVGSLCRRVCRPSNASDCPTGQMCSGAFAGWPSFSYCDAPG
jgi:hypothetical protein